MSRGRPQMDEIPLTPAVNGPSADSHGNMYAIHTHIDPAEYRKQAEKRRKRWAKEEKKAAKGSRKNRKCTLGLSLKNKRKRRCWLLLLLLLLLLIGAGVAIGVAVSHKGQKHQIDNDGGDNNDTNNSNNGDTSQNTTDMGLTWVNITGFPPMPTGVLTIVGPENTLTKSDCTGPLTLWSCSLPKELHSDVAPFDIDSPTITLKIQYDNGTDNKWKTAWENNDTASYASFTPLPTPPTIAEIAFLGNYTDDVQSDKKEGEATPFYISMIDMDQDPNELGTSEITGTMSVNNLGVNLTLPLPQSNNDDGTPANARLFPRLRQQPVRLFDRDLSTEHYGFYQYFRRTIYATNISNNVTTTDATDNDGGAPIEDATHIVTWSQTRVKVALWTNQASNSLLSVTSAKTSSGLSRPGSMPYPVTVNLDTHGGDKNKVVWAWGMKNSTIDLGQIDLLVNHLYVGGEIINSRVDGNLSEFGGFDGGVGGCKCAWDNFASNTA